MEIVRIPSRLYYDLYNTGGDKLVAIFCILKLHKNQQSKYFSFRSRNGRTVTGLNLLRKSTGISIENLKTALCTLESKGLAQIEENGDIWLIGNNTSKVLYSCDKLVPIETSKSIVKTSMSSYYVRVNSNAKHQNKLIAKKTKRSEQIKLTENPKTLKQYKKGLRALSKYGSIELTPTIVLSNRAYSNIKGSETANQKHNGHYWKKRLAKFGVIKTVRRFEVIRPMNFQEYNLLKKSGHFPKDYVYEKGCLCKELVSELILNQNVLPN